MIGALQLQNAVLFCCLSSVFAVLTPYYDCGSQGILRYFFVNRCVTSPCRFQPHTLIELGYYVESNRTFSDLTFTLGLLSPTSNTEEVLKVDDKFCEHLIDGDCSMTDEPLAYNIYIRMPETGTDKFALRSSLSNKVMCSVFEVEVLK